MTAKLTRQRTCVTLEVTADVDITDLVEAGWHPAPPDLLAESWAREEAGWQAARTAAMVPAPLIPRSAYRDRDGEPGPDPVVFGPPLRRAP